MTWPHAGTTCPEPIDPLAAKEKEAHDREITSERQADRSGNDFRKLAVAGSSQHRRKFVTATRCRYRRWFFRE
ncbi:hypothetical protein SESBI_21455 [Sesbania bispinosa]|nr:hypothetical protein SESBI_21455 [Sesbania bispinosa]